MKKNILKATIVAAFALIAGMNVYNAQKSDVMSELALANVEALASGEGSISDCETYCKSDSRYDCIISWGDGIEGITCTDHRKK
ncbi:MAG: NVEALA domain-containing protein [Bacteroides sp.]|uniref:NVEALA domain-containing protein n=1 Tax=Phocaeicola sartorii TaxID=671267 RepID=UPI001B298D47|nr:NVEALA domain-containing protein [Phocaeicola sartorii]MBO5506491.1 NVEALA domain-containing protein [Bacteroides sp.]